MVLEYLKLFVTFAKIGMFTIGGGDAMIPLIEREIVAKQWMSKEEFMEMFALTQSLPGVFAVNMWQPAYPYVLHDALCPRSGV